MPVPIPSETVTVTKLRIVFVRLNQISASAHAFAAFSSAISKTVSRSIVSSDQSPAISSLTVCVDDDRPVSVTVVPLMIAALTNPFCWLPWVTAAQSPLLDIKTGAIRRTRGSAKILAEGFCVGAGPVYRWCND